MPMGSATAHVTRVAAPVIRYGPVTIRYAAAEPGRAFRLRYPLALFVDAAFPPHEPAHLEIVYAEGVPERLPQLVYSPQESWELRRDGSGREQILFPASEKEGRIPLMELTFDRSFRSARFVQRVDRIAGRDYTIGFPIDQYVVSRLLGRMSGGLVVHASAVLYGGHSYVFLGHSGAGKTTIARLAESVGAEILSDERVIVTHDGGVAIAWGTPWHGTCDVASPRCAPIRGIFTLVQAADDSVAPIGPAAALSETFVRLYQPTVDVAELHLSLSTLERVVTDVPSFELRFRPTPAAFEMILEAGKPATGCAT